MQTYIYNYDPLNRLKKAAYSATGKVNFHNEELAYDNMGNIDTLRRTNGGTGWSNHFKYHYTGNRLKSVADAGSAGMDNGYTYDENGNGKSNSRLGITDIEYNYLNLPSKYTKGSQNLLYTYDATGRKLTKQLGTSVTQYVDGIQYKDGAIEFIQTEEGRMVPNGSSFIYEYFLRDHLGNVRAVVDHTGVVKQIQDYFPFGMEMNPGNTFSSSPINQYKYNGKEKQVELGLDQLDYGARFYDPVIGRWGSVDPLAEAFDNVSPYNYGMNNPMRFVDPTGMAAMDTTMLQEVVIWAKKTWNETDFSKLFGDFMSGNQVSDMERSLDLYETEGFNSYIYSQIGSAHRDAMFSMMGQYRGGKGPRVSASTIKFRNLPIKGKIDPKKIRFSQNSISRNFKDKTSVTDLTQKLKSGAVSPDAVTPIRIVEKDGLIYTLDNRRLKAFQDAGVPVNYQKLDAIPPSEQFKFTTTNQGASIEIR